MADSNPVPPFTLSRASRADMPSLVACEYECFPPFIREAFMGCTSTADIPKLAEYYNAQQLKDPFSVWIKVVDNASGRIIAGSQWKVFPSGEPDSNKDEPPPWLDGEARSKSAEMMKVVNEKRRAANAGGGYVQLHICFTHPGFRRQRAGSMMLKWGCDVADALHLPGWIEASDEGNFLYKRFGFYDYERVTNGELTGTNMKRNVTKFG